MEMMKISTNGMKKMNNSNRLSTSTQIQMETSTFWSKKMKTKTKMEMISLIGTSFWKTESKKN